MEEELESDDAETLSDFEMVLEEDAKKISKSKLDWLVCSFPDGEDTN